MRVRSSAGSGSRNLGDALQAGTRLRSAAKVMRLTTALLVGCFVAACRVRTPVLVLGGCVSPAVQEVQDTGRTAERRCDFDRSTTFVALPPITPTKHDLVAAGLAEDAALILSKGVMAGSRWCGVEKGKSTDSATKPGWETACTQAELDINRLMIASGRSFVVMVGPSTGGTPMLIQIRAVD